MPRLFAEISPPECPLRATFRLGEGLDGEYNYRSAWGSSPGLLFNNLAQATCVGARTGTTVYERQLGGALHPQEKRSGLKIFDIN